ncbi:uncharacterized protein ACIBXB_006143 [Morphnus guianensis]
MAIFGGLRSTAHLHGLQGDSLLSHHWLQGINLLRYPSSPSFTDLGICIGVPLTFQSPYSLPVPLLKYAIPEALPLSLIGLAWARGRSDLEPGELLAASHGSHPCGPSPTTKKKPTPHKPITDC